VVVALFYFIFLLFYENISQILIFTICSIILPNQFLTFLKFGPHQINSQLLPCSKPKTLIKILPNGPSFG
jgi:D-alanyl-lipoteichoic acid acyltransferase DltB (MBOAT superfamily)